MIHRPGARRGRRRRGSSPSTSSATCAVRVRDGAPRAAGARRHGAADRLRRRAVHASRRTSSRAGRSRDYLLTKRLMYEEPEALAAGSWASSSTRPRATCNGQIAAGAEAVQIFDSWVGVLAPDDYRTFVLPHTRRAHPGARAGDAGHSLRHGHGRSLLRSMREAGGDVIGLDWRVDLDAGWAAVGHDVAVQGNLDPAVLLSQPAVHPRAREGHPRARRRPPGPHLQPRPRDPPADTGRARPRAGRDGPRAVRPPMKRRRLGAAGRLRRPDGGRTRSGPFSRSSRAGGRIPPERLEEVAHHYELMPGGRSPLNALTFAPGPRRSSKRWRAAGPRCPCSSACATGIRSCTRRSPRWPARARGARSPSSCRRCARRPRGSATCETSRRRARASRARPRSASRPPGRGTRASSRPSPIARRAALAEVPAGRARRATPLVFTAHSVPVGDGRAARRTSSDLTAAARAVARRLGHRALVRSPTRAAAAARASRGSSPTSRRAPPRWRPSGEQHAVVVPIGFVCDHVEVLYDLDVEARRIAAARGHRASPRRGGERPSRVHRACWPTWCGVTGGGR